MPKLSVKIRHSFDLVDLYFLPFNWYLFYFLVYFLILFILLFFYIFNTFLFLAFWIYYHTWLSFLFEFCFSFWIQLPFSLGTSFKCYLHENVRGITKFSISQICYIHRFYLEFLFNTFLKNWKLIRHLF